MKRVACGFAATLVLAVLSLSPALAQNGHTFNDRLILKGGLFFPTSSESKDLGKTWFGGGAELLLTPATRRGIVSAELLYTGKKESIHNTGFLDVRSKFSDFSLKLNYKIRSHPESEGGNVFFYGVGAGADLTRVESTDPNEGASEPDEDSSKTLAGADIFVGYETSDNTQLELKYNRVFGKNDGNELDGVFLLFGVKI